MSLFTIKGPKSVKQTVRQNADQRLVQHRSAHDCDFVRTRSCKYNKSSDNGIERQSSQSN